MLLSTLHLPAAIIRHPSSYINTSSHRFCFCSFLFLLNSIFVHPSSCLPTFSRSHPSSTAFLPVCVSSCQRLDSLGFCLFRVLLASSFARPHLWLHVSPHDCVRVCRRYYTLSFLYACILTLRRFHAPTLLGAAFAGTPSRLTLVSHTGNFTGWCSSSTAFFCVGASMPSFSRSIAFQHAHNFATS